ncbi:penicillin-binding transpeptidase domain-containing protein [Paenibacillus sp. YYML68]|uniref:penicillin-binding transpeptidase domain-containing protein n=1 Tax=Paenibacillus sp. YYML68 TaxID=2909250 RepID=UPI00249148AD|nr:penicillin-binding transpeptidase domain-containing protein [Paenibacillus sp. YYML68]
MTKQVMLRSLLIGGGFTLLFAVLISRLYWVQIVQGEELLSQAKEKWAHDKEIPAVRGSIVDRSGRVLAEDAPSYTVALEPRTIMEKGLELDVIKGLAAILSKPDDAGSLIAMEERIRTRLNRKREDTGAYYAQVELGNEGWKIDAATADKIKLLKAELESKLDKKNNSTGILLLPQRKRFYPSEKLASHVIGYTNKEDKPAMGLELALDNYLKGSPGWLIYEKDRYGVELPDSQRRYKAAVNGNNVKLTLDKNIQFYLESAIEKSFDKYKPKSMTAIAVDPQTMEILGLANVPNFNPNKYWEMKERADINHAVASQYEPGSTFKLVTLAASLEQGLFNPNETYQSGSIKIADRRLHDHNISGWGKITYLEGLLRSSNVAFVKLGTEKLGQDKLREAIDRFGFGVKTGVDLPGEVPGIVNMRFPSEFATATYGQGLTATAIQQVTAYAAVANGGKLMKPHIIKEITNPETGEVVEKFEPQVVRQVISSQTASKVSEYLEQVVSNQEIGTGKRAHIDGYRIAGKTGTANKVVSGEKGYAEGKWVISFIGYAPIENPRILVAIIADEPDLGGNYQLGGEVAAPAFREIVSQSLRYLGVAPSTVQVQAAPASTLTTGLDETVQAPELTGKSVEEARELLQASGLSFELHGRGQTIVGQSPMPGADIQPSQPIYLRLSETESIDVPSLSGKSLRDALEVCSLLKLRCTYTGEGYVADQSLEGEGEERVLTLTLKSYRELQQAPAAAKTSESKGAKPTSVKQ